MTPYLQRAAKRLAVSLLALSALGGCAVYAPPGPYGYYGADANGQAVYGSPYYGPAYYGPAYIAAPGAPNFGLRSLGGGGGRGGFRGGRGGFHGGGDRGGHGGGGRH